MITDSLTQTGNVQKLLRAKSTMPFLICAFNGTRKDVAISRVADAAARRKGWGITTTPHEPTDLWNPRRILRLSFDLISNLRRRERARSSPLCHYITPVVSGILA